MKKLSLLVLVGVIVIIVGLIVIGYLGFRMIGQTPVIVDKAAATTEKALQAIEKAKPYTIEQISPEWIMVRAKNNRWGKYAEALTKGLKELEDRNYIIIDIKPIQEHHYREDLHANFSAPVQTFLVKVEPKY